VPFLCSLVRQEGQLISFEEKYSVPSITVK
jgi:hypothetical protein